MQEAWGWGEYEGQALEGTQWPDRVTTLHLHGLGHKTQSRPWVQKNKSQSTFIIEILTHMLAEGPSRDLLRALVKSRDDSSSNST